MQTRQMQTTSDVRDASGKRLVGAMGGARTVLDLHDLVAAHVTSLDEAERIVDAEGREDAEVTLGEHGDRLGGGAGGDRGLEGLDGLEESKGDDSDRLHDYQLSAGGGRGGSQSSRPAEASASGAIGMGTMGSGSTLE